MGSISYEYELEHLRQEERAEGRTEGALSMLAGLVKDGILTKDATAKRANLSVDEFEKQAALLPV